MKKLLYFLACSSLLFSCKPSKEKLLSHKWIAVKMESAQLDKDIAERRLIIDTIARNTTPEENLRLYGIRNMDSMRLVMKAELDAVIAEQAEMIKNTWLDFHKDGTAITNFGASPDTISWRLEEDHDLIMEEKNRKTMGSGIKMEIVKLDKTELRLRFNENGFSSTATFRRETE